MIQISLQIIILPSATMELVWRMHVVLYAMGDYSGALFHVIWANIRPDPIRKSLCDECFSIARFKNTYSEVLSLLWISHRG